MQKMFVLVSAAIFDSEQQQQKESIEIIQKFPNVRTFVGVSSTEYFNRNDNCMLYCVLCTVSHRRALLCFSFFPHIH